MSCARFRAHRARGRLRSGAARTAARGDRAPPLRLRHAAAAAVRPAVLEEARTAGRLRHRWPTGAVWDGNEQQRGGPGILSFLAGGEASGAIQDILAREGEAGVIRRIEWLGQPSTLLASRTIVWDHDPWARGGYAYFDPGFDPLWRAWLARPAGRIVFAGEHTSIKSQGYMNGAIETGLRAAAEIAAIGSPA